MIENKYAKIVDAATKLCSVGLGDNDAFYEAEGFIKMDVEQSWEGKWYVAGYAPAQPHNDVIKKQIEELESQITDRNIRGAIMGDEFAINKINEIEAQIAELRRQLEAQQ